VLLSGGIDSPVAGYLMAGRGLRIECVYFHTHPYTSPEVREKVKSITETLYAYLPAVSLYVVPFTDIQVRIKEKAAPEELTLLTRAAMMEIASLLARRQKARCLITGESLGQVASQTVQSITFTDSVARLPVFRPLIGLSKERIIALAREIGTYETSILPYPDCCALFAPEHPLTHPRADLLRRVYEELELDGMIRETLGGTERLRYRRDTRTRRETAEVTPQAFKPQAFKP